ncbi:MAG TPA: circadian clock protein KaiC, partial [Fontimonas sp.]
MSKNSPRNKRKAITSSDAGLAKVATGVRGLDEITLGGLPKGRATLICGGAGCGKTLLAMAFLAHGAQHGEPGVMMSFEESDQDIALNLRSLGQDIGKLIRSRKLAIDQVRLHRHEIDETGSYDLEALFVRLNYAIDSIGAKRVVLDSIETIFGGLSDQGLIRSELRRLFEWLKEKGVTAVVTGERGDGDSLTRHGLEEYISDCVIVLDHRVVEQVSTRRLRVVKYRGSAHGANEYPFLIDESGLSVLPVTSLRLEHAAFKERVSSGIAGLDAMLGGKGYYRGSTILVSGSAGSGKTSVCAHFAHAACARGERCIIMAFEESQSQWLR